MRKIRTATRKRSRRRSRRARRGPAMTRRGHRIGNHEEREQQQRAVHQLMRPHRPALAEIRDAHRQRADIESQEAPADIGAPRAPRDRSAQHDHPSRERDILAPLAGRNPRARESSSAAPTPKLAGLNRCLPRTRSTNFDAIAKTAAAGSAHRLSARKSSVRLSAVIVALSRLGAGLRVSRSSRRWTLSAAANVSAICAGRRLKSRKYAPAASSDSQERYLENPRVARHQRRGARSESASGAPYRRRIYSQ